MIENKKVYIFFTICFMITTFTFSIALSSVYPFYREAIETNEFLSNFKEVTIVTSTEEEMEKICKEVESIGVDDFLYNKATYRKDVGNQIFYNEVTGCGTYSNIEKYIEISGENFTKEDLSRGAKKAIIGRGLEGLTVEEDNKRYLDIFGDKYEVISFIENTEEFFYASFVPMYSINIINNEYDMFKMLITNENIDKLKAMDKESYSISVREFPKVRILEFLLDRPTDLEDRALQLSICLINVMVFAYFFSKAIRKRISIMRVLGADGFIVFKEVFKNIISSSMVGAVLGLIFAQIIILYMQSINQNLYREITPLIALYTVIIILGLTVLSSVVVLMDLLRFKVIKEVRK